MQDYLRDSPANDRTAQALQGLTFGGGGEGIGLRIGGLLQAQAQAQYGGGMVQARARFRVFYQGLHTEQRGLHSWGTLQALYGGSVAQASACSRIWS